MIHKSIATTRYLASKNVWKNSPASSGFVCSTLSIIAIFISVFKLVKVKKFIKHRIKIISA